MNKWIFFSKIIRCQILLISSLLIPTSIWAQSSHKAYHCVDSHPWFVTGSLGYTNYLDMYLKDGQTSLARFSIGRNLIKIDAFDLSLEAGVQNGNVMRLPLHPDHTLEFAEFAELNTKPLLDLLFTLKIDPLMNAIPLFIAYQRLSFIDRDSAPDKETVSFEGQVGLDYWVNHHTNIYLSYQRVFGANPNFQVNEDKEKSILRISLLNTLSFLVSVLIYRFIV